MQKERCRKRDAEREMQKERCRKRDAEKEMQKERCRKRDAERYQIRKTDGEIEKYKI